jgi:hypothetical protein
MPSANAPPSEEGSGSKDSETVAATPVSCVDAFDALWFCYSPAHQVRSSRLNHGTICVAAPNFLSRAVASHVTQRSLRSTTARACLIPAHPRKISISMSHIAIPMNSSGLLNFFAACVAKLTTRHRPKAARLKRRVVSLRFVLRTCGKCDPPKKLPLEKR